MFLLKNIPLLVMTKLCLFFSLYVVQGLPFGLQEKFIPLHYRNQGMKYTDLSLFRLIHLPWIGKILMVPFIDKIKSKHFFVTGCLILMAGAYSLISALNKDDYIKIIFLLTLSNVLIVFQDMILDAMVITNLSEDKLGYGNIAQVIGYKIGIILGGGGFGILTRTLEWSYVFSFISLIQLSAGLISMFFFCFNSQISRSQDKNWLVSKNTSKHKYQAKQLTMQNENKEENTQYGISSSNEQVVLLKENNTVIEPKDKNYSNVFWNSDTIWLITFVLVYKLGETGIVSFFPLFLMDAGMKIETLHFWNGIVSQAASILGSLFGGLISPNDWAIFRNLWRVSTFRAIIMFALLLFCLCIDEHIIEGSNSWKFIFSILLLILISFISGTLTTITFTLMMIASKRVPLSHQTSHYSLLAVSELTGKLIMLVFIGPIIDFFGKAVAIFMYCTLNIIVFPILMKYPKSLRHFKR